jgi:hypothetical protein
VSNENMQQSLPCKLHVIMAEIICIMVCTVANWLVGAGGEAATINESFSVFIFHLISMYT